MKITIDLTESQIKSISDQLGLIDPNQLKLPLSDFSEQFKSISGLKHLAMTEYSQNVHQIPVMRNIFENILSTAVQIGLPASIFDLVKRSKPDAVSRGLCNVNTRFIVANALLVSAGIEAFTFEKAYLKSLKNNGLFAGTLNCCNSAIYKSILFDIIKFEIVTERNPFRFKQFLIDKPNKPVRVWTVADNNKDDTHATILYFDGFNLHCADTSSQSRHGLIDINSLSYLFGRKTDHLESLKQV
jgi:hypothetical protein